MKKNSWIWGTLLIPLLFLCGCRANVYYQAQAVERARQFLLKKAPELTLEEQNFVRYNDPILLHGDIWGEVKSGTKKGPTITLQAERRQICITWDIPTRDVLYLVFGVSTSRMSDWQPNRLIRRSYKKQNYTMQALAQVARTYAQNNLIGRLNAVEINEIRFTSPWLLETDFELNCDPEGKLTEKEREALQKELAGKSQYSLVWKFSGKAVVFCGASTRSLGGWKINFAGILSEKELQEHTRHVWMTPKQALEQLPEELQEPRSEETPVKKSVEPRIVIPTKAPPSPAALNQNNSVSTENSSGQKPEKYVVPVEDQIK